MKRTTHKLTHTSNARIRTRIASPSTKSPQFTMQFPDKQTHAPIMPMHK